jgi:hypothetical protein
MKKLLAVWGVVCLSALVLGTGVASGQSTGSIVGWGSQVVVEQSALEDLVAVAGGSLHSLGLKSDGTVVAWGWNADGQCDVPVPNADFVAVAGGWRHSLGLKSDGTVVAWGNNDYGQCDVPVPNADFVAVAGDGYYSLGLKSDGTVAAWGRNDYGECDVPVPNADFVAVAGGSWHSLGLKSDGTIVVWGDNYEGQCDVPAPNADFVAVAGGWRHSLGLKSDGTVVAWGYNDYGQCDVPAPNADFVAVAGGWDHSLGLKSDGTSVPSVLPGTPAFGIRYVMPNPATARASIGYSLPEGWRSARLSVHDVAGRLVRRLDPATERQGFAAVDWDGTANSGERVASGVYFIRLEVDGEVATHRMVLLR